MTVRAKFQVQSVEGDDRVVVVRLNAATSPPRERDENHYFWDATPAGQITLHITNPTAHRQFHPGDEFYVDFVRVERSGG